ncbi:MAG: 3'-5' exonuclease [Pirellulaceae bacterium]
MNKSTTSRCFNETEADEREYLEQIKAKINAELKAVSNRVEDRHSEMQDLKTYLEHNKQEMDHVEKASVRQSVNMMSTIGEHAADQKARLIKLLNAPYFGRIDIQGEAHPEVHPTYIGIHSLYDAEDEAPLIHDWRAPVSSMFYEFELGEAHYDAPGGRTECQLLRKRQYRIENRQLAFMLESSLNIQDDILQKELSRASDDKMKNIVATIQRDQNAIIRNDQTHTLIIQGAAGSGKTSIALHRIAFLLYKYKETIRSDEILIVSPNKVFAHYISQVLPELGEEMIQETTMEVLASDLLEDKVKFQTFAEQVALLLVGKDESYGERVRFKATPEFLRKLDEYGNQAQSVKVVPTEVRVGLFTVDQEFIATKFRRYAGRAPTDLVAQVFNDVVDYMSYTHGKSLAGKDRTKLRGDLRKMITTTTLKAMYKNFYEWLGEPGMFKLAKGSKYEYSDVFPLIYLKMLVEGLPEVNRIKHIVIDEMQDYTPVQYEVIASLYSCKKTILGDHNQSVSPLSSSSAEAIRDILPDAECMYMHKSYRSTIEITELAQSIHHNANLVPIERHGEKPTVIACQKPAQEVDQIRAAIKTFHDSQYNSLGIICKTQQQADSLHKALAESRVNVRLLNPDSTIFSDGVMIATAYLAKGLEFDQVIVPFCDEKSYQSVIDRHMLYVAVTRAMHSLTLTHTGKLSPLLTPAVESGKVQTVAAHG